MENLRKKILPYNEIMTKFCIAYILVRPSDRAHAGWRHFFDSTGWADTSIFWTLLCKTIVRILRHSLQSVGCRMGERDHWSLYVSFGWEVMKSNALLVVLSRLSIGEEFVKLNQHCCFGPLQSACEIGHSTPSKICNEKMSWTLGKL